MKVQNSLPSIISSGKFWEVKISPSWTFTTYALSEDRNNDRNTFDAFRLLYLIFILAAS
jgi:hypothetical protein